MKKMYKNNPLIEYIFEEKIKKYQEKEKELKKYKEQLKQKDQQLKQKELEAKQKEKELKQKEEELKQLKINSLKEIVYLLLKIKLKQKWTEFITKQK